MNGICKRLRKHLGRAEGALLALILPALTASITAREIGFIERFALAENRAEALEELIPGTDDYYFFHALHYQNTHDEVKFETTMEQWKKRFERSAQREVLENRQALINYEKNPQATLEYLVRELGLKFNHSRERRQTNPGLATELDQALIQLETIVKRSLRKGRGLGEVSPAGIDWLMRHWPELDLSIAQKRELLGKLTRPDYANLVSALAEALSRRESRGFGEFAVHRQLLRDQLDALAEARPDLLGDEAFVLTKLGKLRPGADVDLSRDPVEKERYLDGAWLFVSGLGPVFHSLKANLLYERLQHDKKRGALNRERFLTYLKLPRPVGHVNPKYRERLDLWRHPVDMSFDCSKATGFPPIRDDQALVDDYLLHFLTGASDYEDFAPYVTDAHLKALHAEANIVAGLGEVEQWASNLSPSAYQTLKERVDLDFDPTCKDRFGEGETVSLDVRVKNVENLIVKIYEINTENYYRNFGRQINTDLNLDGLVANEELSFHYDESPFRRVKRSFSFPQLNASRGVWVLEFIGNGKSSRAVILRGGLQYIMRPSSAGHALRILDENRQSVPGAYVWVQEKRYDPDEAGEILIPFSNRPGPKQIVLHDDQGFAVLENLTLQGERYGLAAGFYIDREELLAGREATLAVRPQFTLNGAPADIALLEEVVLTIKSTDLDGVEATSTVSDFKLYGHKESTHQLRVPERLASLAFELTAKVKNLSAGGYNRLTASHGLAINEMARTDAVADLFLSKVDGGYHVQLLGRNGEPVANSAIDLNLRRDDFRTDVHATLKTDETGTAHLGALNGIYRVRAQAPNGRAYRWILPKDRRLYPSTIHARVGELVTIPLVRPEADGKAFSLLETARGTYVRDHREAISVENGFLSLQGLPPGDFQLFLREAEVSVTVRISAGEETKGFILAPARNLEKRNYPALQLEPLKTEGDEMVIQLANVNPYTRIHILGSRYLPPFDAFDSLGRGVALAPLLGTPARAKNLYVSGRDIGDEYRYIIDRHYATKFPGNMLKRPGLLLNPWVLRDTSTEQEVAQQGQNWKSAAAMPEASSAKRAASRRGKSEEVGQRDTHALDFLARTGVASFNLAPGENGEIRVRLADLGDCTWVRVLATDPVTAIERYLALPAREAERRDVRLAHGLNPKRHFTQQDQVSLLQPKKAFAIEDAASASFEVYETLGSVYQLFKTLSQGNATLAEFSFILQWPGLEPERKRELYSKYASHELSFFIQRKDPAFFEDTVLPYLVNKKDKTFMDHYLLGEDLSVYLAPWQFSQLNVVERILLADGRPEERDSIARDVGDWLAMSPPEKRLDYANFATALGGAALDELQTAKTMRRNARALLLRRREREKQGVAAGKDHLEEADEMALADLDKFGAEQGKKTPGPRLSRRRRLGEQVDGKAKDLVATFGFEVGGMAERLTRDETRRFYRRLETTKEWAENNYYHLPIEAQNRDLITVNKFWNDFAQREPEAPFVSRHITEPTRNFTEMLLALAVLDLPFESDGDGDRVKLDEARLTLKPDNPAILFHKEIRETAAAGQGTKLLVGQNFFREGDRYGQENGEQVDKFITGEFLSGVVYGCKVVVTNPTSSIQRLDLLQQIPEGAIPVNGGKATHNRSLRLESYQTHSHEYFFYFPEAGTYQQFPVHVSKDQKVVAFADPFAFEVVDELTETDTASWAYVSQWGSESEVLAHLNEHNLRQTDLSKIAWRCRASAAFFTKVIELLQGRHHYDHLLYGYALHHHQLEPLQQYLLHEDAFLAECGDFLDSKLLSIDPVERKHYQHLDYRPLVNARRYVLGGKRKILNDRFREQYRRLMHIFSQRPSLDDEDRMTLTVYLLLQDRIEQALAIYKRVNRQTLATQIQYDYLQAFLSLYLEEPSTARAIADRYASHPVDHWRKRFQEVAAHLDEIEGKVPRSVDEEDRNQLQNQLAANDPSLTLKVENQQIDVLYRNLKRLTVNYYRMDLEFLFSTNPFMSSDSARFSMIKPNRRDRLSLDPNEETLSIPLPSEFEGENVLVEIVGGGIRRASAYYSNRLNVQLAANHGQLQIRHATDGQRPLAKVYVKVYAEIDGQPHFYKDGYTDLRGKFDYASLNTSEIERASRFSLLVMSDQDGALVLEAKPPQQ